MAICKTCKREMMGWSNDEECSDCALFGKGGLEKFHKSFEDNYFERTGVRKTTGEILRGVLNRACEGYPEEAVKKVEDDLVNHKFKAIKFVRRNEM